MCNVLKLNRSTFYKILNHQISNREIDRLDLESRIIDIFDEYDSVYGAPKIHELLLAQGYYASIKRIGSYMKRLNLKSIIKIKYRPFVKSKAPDDKQNLMNKDFTTTATNQKWVMDITYIKTVQKGWTFLASVMDLNSRMIIGYVYEKHMRKEMVIESIKQAIDKAGFTEGLMVQSDLGSQYLSYEVESLLEKYGIIHSYSRKGSPGDNSPMEAFHSVLKREYVSRQLFKDFEAAKLDIFQYIEGFYNRKRIHGSIGYKTPIKVYYSK